MPGELTEERSTGCTLRWSVDFQLMSRTTALIFKGSSLFSFTRKLCFSPVTSGINNSISVAGVGTSASVSFSVTDYSGTGDAVSKGAFTTGQIDIVGTNIGSVAVNTGMATPTISGGLQNSISAAAVGASASQSVSHTILPAL